MQVTLLDILVLLSLGQGFIFGSVLLFAKIFKGSANKYLAYAIIIISIIGMDEWLSDWGFDDLYYFIDYFGDDVPWILLVFVPIFYFFLTSLKHPLAKHPYLPLLTLPFWIYLVLNLIINFEYDFQWYQMPNMKSFRFWVYRTEFYLGPVYSLLLCGLSYNILRKSKEDPEKVQWLKKIWSFLLLLLVFWLFDSLVPGYLAQTEYFLFYGLWLGISIFIYWITFKGLYQFRLVENPQALSTVFQGIPSAISKSKKSPAFDRNNSYLKSLDQLLVEKKLFTNPDLSRDQVAEHLGISSGYLSQIINQATGNNFNAYINAYRVKEAQRMIQDPASDRFSLLAIGMEAGFKSKSAFYTSFKKITGMTPSQYKKQR